MKALQKAGLWFSDNQQLSLAEIGQLFQKQLTDEIAVIEVSSTIGPHRTSSDKVVYSLLLHRAVRKYRRYF